MSTQKAPKQFAINPLEILILAGVSGLLGYSVLHLFEDQTGIKSAMVPTAQSSGREPASGAEVLASVEVDCAHPNLTQATAAPRIRLSGYLCGSSQLEPSVEPKIENQSNRMPASVFINPESRKFSTDYLALNPGKNIIEVTYSPNDAQKKHTLLFEITRNN